MNRKDAWTPDFPCYKDGFVLGPGTACSWMQPMASLGRFWLWVSLAAVVQLCVAHSAHGYRYQRHRMLHFPRFHADNETFPTANETAVGNGTNVSNTRTGSRYFYMVSHLSVFAACKSTR